MTNILQRCWGVNAVEPQDSFEECSIEDRQMRSIFDLPERVQPNWNKIIREYGMDDCSGEYYTNSFTKGLEEREKKMVQITKAEVGGTPFLNKKIVQEKGVKKVKITTEPKMVDTEYEGKKSTRLECVCSTQVDDPKDVTWQMNPTTQNHLIEKFGTETKNWVGKEIEIAVKQAGSASPGVYPKDCSLEKVLS